MTGDEADTAATVWPGPSTVHIHRAVLDELVAHARDEAPNECCGILIGAGFRINRSVRARNTLDSPTRYLIDPRDQIAAMKSARARGEVVVGFYHSHPSSAPVPSETDRSEATYPGHCYLIVFPGNDRSPAEVRGFRLHGSGNFLAVTLVPFA